MCPFKVKEQEPQDNSVPFLQGKASVRAGKTAWGSTVPQRSSHSPEQLFILFLLRANQSPEMDPHSYEWRRNDCVFCDSFWFLLKSELVKMSRAWKLDPLPTPGISWTWPPTPKPVPHSPLKYFTVFTFSSRVASSSHTNTVRGCCWKADTVHIWFTPSSMALYRANALWAPVMRIITWGSENKPMTEEELWNQALELLCGCPKQL